MTDFFLWFSTGFEHIADWNGYDHILFLLALCCIYPASQWKKVLLLITAFTVGHSLTLAMSVLHIITISSALVEFLIPVTILLTCIFNIYRRNREQQHVSGYHYSMALFFGLIHGLGFSTLLKSLLGSTESIASPLLAFNLGLEAGQIVIVSCILIFSLFLSGPLKVKRADIIFFISSAVSGISFIMAAERLRLLTS